jgi:hypothetical protein
MRNAYILVAKPVKKRQLGVLRKTGRIILKRTLNKVWECGLDSSEWEYGLVVGSCETSNEPSAFITGGKFTDQLNKYQFLKDNLAPLSYKVCKIIWTTLCMHSSIEAYIQGWRWRQYSNLKRCHSPKILHDARNQKTTFCIHIAVKTSNSVSCQ